MRIMKRITAGIVIVAGLGVCQFAGCGGLLPQVEVPVELGGNSTFAVEPGVPVSKTLSSTFDNGGIMVGNGSIAVKPDVVSVNRNSAKTAQAIEGCTDACTLAGLSAAQCDQICADGEVHIVVRVAGGGQESTVCTSGDRYPPTAQADAYRVTLENDLPTSVTPNTVQFTQGTINAFNAGSATFCITVIAGFSGEVILDEVTLSAGL